MPKPATVSRSAALILALAVAGCVTPPPPKPVPVAVAVPIHRENFWNGEGVAGAPSITIVLHEQRAYFRKDGKIVGETSISSGKKGFDTPLGDFKIIQRDKDHVSNLYGEYVNAEGEVVKRNVDVNKDPMPEGAEFRGAKMPYFLRFHAGAGMHAGRLQGGHASHGCVRLPRAMVEHFFENAPLGTPVTVKE